MSAEVEIFDAEVIEGEIVERLFGTSPADLIDRYASELPRSSEEDALARAGRIEVGFISYFQVRQDIADAFARRDWDTLGHDSWEDYLFTRFGDQIRKLVRRLPVERVVAVQDLRSQGLSTREISEKLQIGKGTVHRDLQVPQSGAPEGAPTAAEVRRDVAHDASKPEPPAAPEKVTGKDHKQYPAKREPKPSTQDKPAEEQLARLAAQDQAEGESRDSRTAEALDRYLSDDPALQVSSWRKAYMSAITASFKVAVFTPEAVAANADRDLMQELARLVADITDYARRCEEAWNKANGGLRLVGGQQ